MLITGYLYDDKLVIIYNHKDGAETISLDNVETSLAKKENGSDYFFAFLDSNHSIL